MCEGERVEEKKRCAPGVDLDHAVLAAVRVKRVLDIALADDAEVADDLHANAQTRAVRSERTHTAARGDAP